jgi:hypothetical protein
MQTFLPYPDFSASAKCLDYRRLGKQRVEAAQLLVSLDITVPGLNTKPNRKQGWKNHPARVMWIGHELALADYMNVMIQEWRARGYNNQMQLIDTSIGYTLPSWFGNPEVHSSHRANLLRKDPNFYGKYGWQESPEIPYFWPITK